MGHELELLEELRKMKAQLAEVNQRLDRMHTHCSPGLIARELLRVLSDRGCKLTIGDFSDGDELEEWDEDQKARESSDLMRTNGRIPRGGSSTSLDQRAAEMLATSRQKRKRRRSNAQSKPRFAPKK